MRYYLDSIVATLRPLPVALARQLAHVRPGDARAAVLNRLFAALSPLDKLACRAEMHAIRSGRVT